MGLDKKSFEISTKRKHSDYEKSLITQYDKELADGHILDKTRKRGPTLAQKIAFAKTEKELNALLMLQSRLNDKESRIAYRSMSANEIIDNNPNYFITLSMDACFNKKWHLYDRNHKTKKLYRSVLIFLKKLYPLFEPSLRDKPFEEWPFFIAVMEHFDDEGNLVAPHIHLLLKLDVDIKTLRAAVEDLWGKAVPEAGKNGIDIQYLNTHGLPDRARYLFKHAYQDHEFKLDNGAVPELVCKRYGWGKESVSHDMWMIRRENFRAALRGKSHTQ